MNTLLYLRVSDPRQATPDRVSLTDQRASLEKLASSLGRTVDEDGVFADPGVSGGTANREGFQRLIAHCKANPRKEKDGLVLVYRHDRWGRFDDLDEAAYWTFVVRSCGFDVRFAEGSSTDPVVRPILDVIGRMGAMQERHRIMSRAKAGMRGAANRGEWCNIAPFGYRRMATDRTTGVQRVLESGQRKSANERLTLTPGPDAEVEIVKWMFARYATGEESLSSLHAQLAERWPVKLSWSFVRHAVSNPSYCGDIVASRGGDTPITVANAFPALIERDTFTAVQDVLLRNRRETSPVRYGYPLSGLITCGTCGSPFVGGGHARGQNDPTSRRSTFFYKDSGYSKDPSCPGKLMTMLRRAIEPRIINAIADVVKTPEFTTRLSRAFDEMLTGEQQGNRKAELAQRRTRLTAKRDRLVAAIADDTLSKEEAGAQLHSIRRELDQVQHEIDQQRFAGGQLASISAERDRVLAVASDFAGVAGRADGAVLRELLRPWIEYAVVDKAKRTLTVAVRPAEVVAAQRGGSFRPMVRLARERRCWPGGCRRSCRR